MVTINRTFATLACYAIILISLSISLVWAEDSLQVRIIPESGSVSDIFTLEITASSGTEPPELSPSSDFDIVGRSTKSSTTISSGHLVQRNQYLYSLRPRRSGQLRTPALRIQQAGGLHEKTGLPVNVSVKAPVAKVSEELFLRQSSSQQSVYLGEQLVQTVALYTTQDLHELQFENVDYDGFWRNSFEQPQNYLSTFQGRQYRVRSQRSALFPLRTGVLQLPALRANAKQVLRRRGASLWDEMFSSGFGGLLGSADLQAVSIESNQLSITVKDLPPAPADQTDWGLSQVIVGGTELDWNCPLAPIQLGESLTCSLSLKSTGNIAPIRQLPLTDSEQFKVYQEAPTETQQFLGDKLLLERQFRLSILPLAPGLAEIPPLELGFFDPQSGEYRIAATQPLSLTVKGERPERETPTSPAAASPGVAQPPATPWPLYQPESFWERLSSRLSLSLSIFSLSAVSLLALLSYLIIELRSGHRPRRAAIKGVLRSRDLHELQVAFNQFLGAFLDLTPQELCGEPLRLLLRHRVKDDSVLFALENILDEIEGSLYGATPSPTQLADLKEKICGLSNS